MTTFEQLLNVVKSTANLQIPTSKNLLERGEAIVAKHETNYYSLVVFESGFIHYILKDDEGRKAHDTVWAVDRCRYMLFRHPNEISGIMVMQSEFKDLEWFYPVEQICNSRVRDNIEVERAKVETCRSDEDISILYSKAETSPFDYDPLDDKVEEALSILTEQQREVFKMVVLCDQLSMEEIAKELGITNKQQVSKQFRAACKKLGIDPKKIRK